MLSTESVLVMASKELAVCVLEGKVKGTLKFEQEVRQGYTRSLLAT